LSTFARILGATGRLPEKKDVPAKKLATVSDPNREVSPIRFEEKTKIAGAYRVEAEPVTDLTGLKVDGRQVSAGFAGIKVAKEEQGMQSLVVTLDKGKHIFELPIATSLRPKLKLQKLDEEGEVLEKLLARYDITSDNLDQVVSEARLEELLSKLSKALEVEADSVGVLDIPSAENVTDRTWLDKDWDLQFVDTREPVSPITE